MAKKEGKNETILVFSAHSDDFVIGAGGTIAKYTEEGKKVIAVVFSYGERSHPWLKEEIVQKMRSEEAWEASKLLHCKTLFFDLRELNFREDYKQKNLEKQLLVLLEKEKPIKIFTHSSEDPHPDHQQVHDITIQLYNSIKSKIKPKPEVYIYSVWNPVSFKTTYPALYVDISTKFTTKLKALKTFHSQKIHVAYPFLLLVYRAFIEGLHIRKRFAEKFFRIR